MFAHLLLRFDLAIVANFVLPDTENRTQLIVLSCLELSSVYILRIVGIVIYNVLISEIFSET